MSTSVEGSGTAVMATNLSPDGQAASTRPCIAPPEACQSLSSWTAQRHSHLSRSQSRRCLPKAGQRQSAHVCRKARSISGIGIEPMTRSTAATATVATLSTITPESPSRPDCRPAGDAIAITTRLGCPARNMRLLIIATPSISVRRRTICCRLTRPHRPSRVGTKSFREVGEQRLPFSEHPEPHGP